MIPSTSIVYSSSPRDMEGSDNHDENENENDDSYDSSYDFTYDYPLSPSRISVFSSSTSTFLDTIIEETNTSSDDDDDDDDDDDNSFDGFSYDDNDDNDGDDDDNNNDEKGGGTSTRIVDPDEDEAEVEKIIKQYYNPIATPAKTNMSSSALSLSSSTAALPSPSPLPPGNILCDHQSEMSPQSPLQDSNHQVLPLSSFGCMDKLLSLHSMFNSSDSGSGSGSDSDSDYGDNYYVPQMDETSASASASASTAFYSCPNTPATKSLHGDTNTGAGAEVEEGNTNINMNMNMNSGGSQPQPRVRLQPKSNSTEKSSLETSSKSKQSNLTVVAGKIQSLLRRGKGDPSRDDGHQQPTQKPKLKWNILTTPPRLKQKRVNKQGNEQPQKQLSPASAYHASAKLHHASIGTNTGATKHKNKKETRKKLPQPSPPQNDIDIDISTPPRRPMEEKTPFEDLSPASAYHASVALQQLQNVSASVPSTTRTSHQQRPRKGIKATMSMSMSTPPRHRHRHRHCHQLNEETPFEDLSPASAYHASVALQQLQNASASVPSATNIESSANTCTTNTSTSTSSNPTSSSMNMSMSMNTIRKETKSIFSTPPRSRSRRRSRAKEGTCTSRTPIQTEKQRLRQDHSLSPASAYHASTRLPPPHAQKHEHEQNMSMTPPPSSRIRTHSKNTNTNGAEKKHTKSPVQALISSTNRKIYSFVVGKVKKKKKGRGRGEGRKRRKGKNGNKNGVTNHSNSNTEEEHSIVLDAERVGSGETNHANRTEINTTEGGNQEDINTRCSTKAHNCYFPPTTTEKVYQDESHDSSSTLVSFQEGTTEEIIDVYATAQACRERLYSLSKERHEDGKRRREAIALANFRRNHPMHAISFPSHTTRTCMGEIYKRKLQLSFKNISRDSMTAFRQFTSSSSSSAVMELPIKGVYRGLETIPLRRAGDMYKRGLAFLEQKKHNIQQQRKKKVLVAAEKRKSALTCPKMKRLAHSHAHATGTDNKRVGVSTKQQPQPAPNVVSSSSSYPQSLPQTTGAMNEVGHDTSQETKIVGQNESMIQSVVHVEDKERRQSSSMMKNETDKIKSKLLSNDGTGHRQHPPTSAPLQTLTANTDKLAPVVGKNATAFKSTNVRVERKDDGGVALGEGNQRAWSVQW